MKTATFQLETLVCPACLTKVEGALKSVAGVDQDSVKVLFNASKAKFNFDEEVVSLEAIQQAVQAVGYEVLKAKAK